MVMPPDHAPIRRWNECQQAAFLIHRLVQPVKNNNIRLTCAADLAVAGGPAVFIDLKLVDCDGTGQFADEFQSQHG